MALNDYADGLAEFAVRIRRASESFEYVLGPEEVAKILDRSPTDVAGLARQGKLRARRIGSHWRFRRRDVNNYLTSLSQIEKSI